MLHRLPFPALASLLLIACGGGVAPGPEGTSSSSGGASSSGASSSSSSSSSGSPVPGGNSTSGAPTINLGVCCAPAKSPGCCMDYGGWIESGACGLTTCDYMPRPDVPGWHIGKDTHGCPVWVEPSSVTSSERCGAATVPDAGPPPADASPG